MPSTSATPRADFARVDPRAVALLAERWARRHLVLPLEIERGVLLVATSDPEDMDAERTVGFATGHRVRWAAATAEELSLQIERWYPDATRPRDQSAPPTEVEHLTFGADGRTDPAADGGASVIRLVDQLLADAIDAGASDLHLEPEEQGIAVRHRVDGVLRPVRTLPRVVAPSLVSRIKILSGLDIADRLRPQDGRARVAVRGLVVDLRVSTLPASHGEKIVVRILDGAAGLRRLDDIGFAADDLERIRTLLDRREGLVLVTGPTGSGKTTTLYAALREIQARGVNVVTVEDPIEYRLAGIVQVQVHERAGLTFGAALRSIMRQDPDVILIGEIRDRETAEIAIQASLTGHLVLSTLHTNDAASAVTRLIDIGVASYQIATAVKGVIAQRLVRRSCVACGATGCSACGGTGYHGRLAIAEILVATPEFERRVATGAPTESLADAARDAGCVSLWESGLALVRLGRTTMDELCRVSAAPVRLVAEPPLVARSSVRGLRIGWLVGAGELEDALLLDARLAADQLGGRIEIVVLDAGIGHAAVAVDAVMARATLLAPATHDRPHGSRLPLTVALAAAPSTRDHVDGGASVHLRLLARQADLVLPHDTTGRVALAAILALLRWRDG